MTAWVWVFLVGFCLGFFIYIRSLCSSKFFGNIKLYPTNITFDTTKVNTVWDDIYLQGYVRSRLKKKRKRGRRYVQIFRGELKGEYSFALVTWRCMNPDYIIAPDEEVHHVDFDPLNDCYENLRMLTHEQHVLIHQRHDQLTKRPCGLPVFNSLLKEQVQRLRQKR